MESHALLGGSRRPLARHVLAAMGFLGFANVYAMRVNLSVAIVAMVNHTAIATNTSARDNATCPSGGGPAPPAQDGPFVWGAQEQGWLLGAFFVGYVVTQLPGGRLAERCPASPRALSPNVQRLYLSPRYYLSYYLILPLAFL